MPTQIALPHVPTAQPHDSLFRRIFSQLAEAAALLRHLFPAWVQHQFDWTTLKLLASVQIDDALQRTEADLVFEIEPKGDPAAPRLLVVLEHQSSPDRFMALRALQYCTGALVAKRREIDPRGLLPWVVPVVVHLGRRPWPYPTTLNGLFGGESYLLPWTPRIDYLLHDCAAADIDLANLGGTPLGRAAQLAILAARGPEKRRAEAIELLAQELVTVWRSDRGPERLAPIFHYLTTQENRDVATAFQNAMAALEEQEPARQFANSVANQWYEEGRVEGREEGRAEGRVEGRVEGERHTKAAVVDGLIRAGASWDLIETATGMDESRFEALKAEVATR